MLSSNVTSGKMQDIIKCNYGCNTDLGGPFWRRGFFEEGLLELRELGILRVWYAALFWHGERSLLRGAACSFLGELGLLNFFIALLLMVLQSCTST